MTRRGGWTFRHAATAACAAITGVILVVSDLTFLPAQAVSPDESIAVDVPPELAAAVERDLDISLQSFLELSEQARVVADALDNLENSVDVRGAELRDGEVIVYIEDDRDAKTVTELGFVAEVGEPDVPDYSDQIFLPANDLRGGLPYFFPGEGPEGFRCSVGFPGVATATGAPQFLTAGHCEGDLSGTRSIMTAVSPGNFRTPFVNVGEPVPNSHVTGGNGPAGGWDHGLVGVTRSGWTSRPEVATWGGGQGSPLSSAPVIVRDATRAVVGAPICKSGGTTGWTCGTITAVNQNLLVGNADDPAAYRVNGIVASICVLGGDSGGAALTGTTAIGVTSASNSQGGCTSGSLGVFAPLYASSGASAETLYQGAWEPSIGIATPLVTTPSTTGSFTGSTMRGALQHGGPRHRIQVTFNGSVTRTATVASNGSWEVSIPNLPNGVTSYSVRARWGERSVSAARTGSWWNFSTARLAGPDRFATAVEISRAAFPSGAPVVVVANGLSFPDALSAGPAAVQLGGPVLLVGPTSIPSVVRAELNRLRPQRIIVVGGTGVVSGAVATELRSFASSRSVTRLGGADRYATSRAIAEFAFPRASEAYIATGAGFADALSAGAAGANRAAPVVLVPGTASSVDSATRALLTRMRVSQIYVAGGTGVVSGGVVTSLRTVASVTRLAGADRFATSLAINQQAVRGSANDALVTYGLNFPDALAGSVLAGVRGAPMYIAPTTCVPRDIITHMRSLSVGRVTLLGGTGVLSSDVGRLRPCA
ncbi:putative cell wall binding repeat protein [Microcella alkaliphila]|uniref:Putative cell wall binding repeat protein n=1 Tax=Microcella alkaliphila TaxID=279828 RepID=A0A4Q7TC96_9MICO|nr:cell wall-binding repeat-containing protein [Microcella alkaliphila]RZT58061.1 putative cell wall binding repeat protein [Microcella alkaliphila]